MPWKKDRTCNAAPSVSRHSLFFLWNGTEHFRCDERNLWLHQDTLCLFSKCITRPRKRKITHPRAIYYSRHAFLSYRVSFISDVHLVRDIAMRLVSRRRDIVPSRFSNVFCVIWLVSWRSSYSRLRNEMRKLGDEAWSFTLVKLSKSRRMLVRQIQTHKTNLRQVYQMETYKFPNKKILYI